MTMESPPALSLWSGGLLEALERRLRIRRGTGGDLLRRALLYVGIGWAGVLLLALAALLISGRRDPLLFDIEAYTRWLLAVPLLLLGERGTERRVVASTAYVARGEVVPEEQEPAYATGLEGIVRLRDSKVLETGLLILAVVTGFPSFFSVRPTLALWWYAFISLPLFRWLLVRWLWRWTLWGLYVFRLSRLPLRLQGSHPDRAGGVGVLSLPSRDFGFFVAAMGTVLAGTWAKPIFLQGERLEEHLPVVVLYVVLMALLTVAPLLPLAGPLVRTRIQAYYDFGLLARRHDERFSGKWIDSAGQDPLGSPDMSSLADLGATCEKIGSLPILPIPRVLLLEILLAALLPMVPLYFAHVPFHELIKKFASKLLQPGGAE